MTESMVINHTVMKYSGTAVNLRIPEGVTDVDNWAFYNGEDNNHSTKRIMLPRSMTTIRPRMCDRCMELEEWFVPSSVTEIGKSSISFENFWDTEFRPFKKIYVEKGSYAENFAIAENIPFGYINETNVVWAEEPESVWSIGCVLTSYTGKDDNVVIPSEITHIASNAFRGNEYVKTIALPEGLEEIGDYAFRECPNLREVIGLENTKITQIPSSLFRESTQLKTVKLPAGVQSIGSGAFYYCTGLEEIVLPNSLIEIGASAFFLCESLKEIEIPSGCQILGNHVFDNSNLTKIVIPKTVTAFGVSVFPKPNDSLWIWGEKGSCIAAKMMISDYNFQIMDENGQPVAPENEKTDDRYKLFWNLLKKAAKELNDPSYCYVCDETMTGYSVKENADFEEAGRTLSELFQVEDEWKRIKDTNSISSLFEMYALQAIAIAIAIKVYICPDVKIDLSFETSKWSGGQASCWWVISPAEEKGKLFSTEKAYENYRAINQFPKNYKVKFDADLSAIADVCAAVEKINIGDKCQTKFVKSYGKYNPCLVLYNESKKVVGTLGNFSEEETNILKKYGKKAYAVVTDIVPLSKRSKGTKYPAMNVDLSLF